MKKRIFLAGLAMVTVIGLTGCGSKSVDVNVQELADALKSGVTYKDDLSTIDLDTAQMIFNFKDADITEAAFYESTGATAEEIVVIKCAEEADAGVIEDSLKARVEEQKESFTDYVPAELEKLNAAVISRQGNCAVLSVSDEPDKARAIIDSYLK
ncbi:MAG: DUF4358 domain-containing protein [Lachnospiraceae bacterium]|nr:DUF4358 domain-containing protein [Lachnospiraceae bacterium]